MDTFSTLVLQRLPSWLGFFHEVFPVDQLERLYVRDLWQQDPDDPSRFRNRHPIELVAAGYTLVDGFALYRTPTSSVPSTDITPIAQVTLHRGDTACIERHHLAFTLPRFLFGL